MDVASSVVEAASSIIEIASVSLWNAHVFKYYDFDYHGWNIDFSAGINLQESQQSQGRPDFKGAHIDPLPTQLMHY